MTDADRLGAAGYEALELVTGGRKLRFLAAECGISLAQAAYRFILSHPGVTTVLGGFSAMSQLEELTAMSGAGPFAPELTARLDALWQSNFG